MKPQAYSNNNL